MSPARALQQALTDQKAVDLFTILLGRVTAEIATEDGRTDVRLRALNRALQRAARPGTDRP
jgi:hypothetical protein